MYNKVEHEGLPTIEEIPKKEQKPCVAECSSYDRITRWWKCEKKGEYLVNGLSLCGTHKNYVLKYGHLTVVTEELSYQGPGRKGHTAEDHDWIEVRQAVAKAERAAQEEADAMREEARYQDALSRLARVYEVSKEALVALLDGEFQDKS